MEEALRTILLGAAGVSALVGTRVDWGLRPQHVAALPAVVLHKISSPRDYNMDGASGLVDSRIQATCYGETYADAKLTARAVMAAVNGLATTQSGVVFQRIDIDNERDGNGEQQNGHHLFWTSIDLQIWHDE